MKRPPLSVTIALVAAAAGARIFQEYRRHARQDKPWDRPPGPKAGLKSRVPRHHHRSAVRTALQRHLAAQPGPKGMPHDSPEYHLARMTSWQHSQWCRRSKRKRSHAKKWADTPRR